MLRNKDLTADPFVFIKLLLDDKIHFRVPLGTRFTMEHSKDFACLHVYDIASNKISASR